MVPVAATIIANGHANRFGNGIQILQQIIDGFRLQVRMSFQGFIHVADISPVMLIMVDFHRFCVDVRFERVKRVRQRRHCECHG